MDELEKNMENILNIEVSDTLEGGCTTRKDQLKDVSEDREKDYEYTRGQLYSLIDKGTEAVNGALEVAQESGHPRAFEVAGNLISQVADVTEKLGKLQSAMKRLKEVPSNAPKNVTNALYVGSTAELQKLLKKDKEK